MKKQPKRTDTNNDLPSEDVMIGYRFLKLTNGDDIVCQLLLGMETAHLLIVRHPMRIVTLIDHSAEQAIHAFTPWIPFTIQEVIAVNRSCLLTMTSVREEIRAMYVIRVTEYLKAIDVPHSFMSDDKPTEKNADDEDESSEELPKAWVN